MISKDLERKIKFLFRGVTSYIIFKLKFRSGFDLSKTIIIAGSTRSGSTWLAELISSIDGHTQLFEPLSPDNVAEVKKIGFKPNMYLKEQDKWEKGKAYFQKVLSGKFINPWIMSQVSPLKASKTNRLVIKFVRANLLLGWMTKNFPILPPVLVIRHPCAIIASQMHKGWTPSLKELLANDYLNEHPELKEKCAGLSSPEERNALSWCLRYHAPLKLQQPQPFMLVTYESLVRNGKEEIEKLFKAWGVEVTSDIESRLHKPSDTVTDASQVVAGKDPLAGWKRKLSEKQINEILKVLEIFGMDFYSEELEPDLEKLERFCGKD